MSKIRDYINERMYYLAELECSGECEDCEKQCRGYADFLCATSSEVESKFNTQCDYTHCGGFDSPGYDIDCYAIAFIDENGKLDIMSFKKERY